MVDYQKLYLHLLRESERAIQTLIEAQQQCEQWYIDSEDTPLTALPGTPSPETSGAGAPPVDAAGAGAPLAPPMGELAEIADFGLRGQK